MQPLVTGKGDKVNTRFIYDSMNRHKSKVSKDLLSMSPRPAHIGLGETHRERIVKYPYQRTSFYKLFEFDV